MTKITRFTTSLAATLLIVLAGSKSSEGFAPAHRRLAFQHGTPSSPTTTKPPSIESLNSFGSSSDCFSDGQKTSTSLSALHAPMVAMGLSKSLVLLKDASGPLVSILEADPDAQAEALLDISHVFLDFTAFFRFNGQFLNYAQLIGRIAFIAIDFLPGHAFHIEEMAVQLFLLGVSIQRMMPETLPTEDEDPMPDPNEIMMWQQEQHQRFLDLGKKHQREASLIHSNNEAPYSEEIPIRAWEEAAISDFAPPFLVKKNN